jgi:hypothetical protein
MRLLCSSDGSYRGRLLKYLQQPNVDDLAKLTLIANKPGLASYPALRSRLRRISGRYRAYIAGDGNAWSLSTLPKRDLTDALRAALRRHYDYPPELIDYLTSIRKELSPDVCSMCGSLKSGSLDHVFPKGKYAEFSFFSKNLVPACDCNIKRGERLKGSRCGQRVLHPYFDSALKRRLVRAKIFSHSKDYAKPEISLVICTRSTNPLYKAVKYHLENVLERTDVLPYFFQHWKAILRNPEDHLQLPKGAFSSMRFDEAVRRQLRILDRRRRTPNNWESMLFAGLTASSNARAFLRQRVRDLRAGRMSRQDA